VNERPHSIEIDSIVLDGVDLRNPRALRGLVESETRRALLRSELTGLSVVAGTEAAIAAEVGRSVNRAITKQVG